MREQQLSWLIAGDRIQQDQELIDFIKETKSTIAIGQGDIDYFKSWIQFVDVGPVNFCIYIQNNDFDLDDLIYDVNRIIDKEIIPGGKIYLALNKYLIHPRRYSEDLPTDFDDAIGIYINRNVNATVDLYKPCGLDGGNKFNWIHPLTRFYLTKNHDC